MYFLTVLGLRRAGLAACKMCSWTKRPNAAKGLLMLANEKINIEGQKYGSLFIYGTPWDFLIFQSAWRFPITHSLPLLTPLNWKVPPLQGIHSSTNLSCPLNSF